MAKAKFKLNKRWGAHVLHNDPGLRARLDEIAEAGATKAGGHVETYQTDRHVAAIVVGAEDQAKDGVATKAMAEVAAEARPFHSRREWRFAFRAGLDNARARARATRARGKSYIGLPESAGRKK